MPVHLLVDQLRFTRREFARCMEGVSEDEACRRVQSLNSLSWMVGHLANQENWYWLLFAQGRLMFPDLNDLVGFRKPATTPSLTEMWSVWNSVTREADAYLDTLTQEAMTTCLEWKGKPWNENIGTLLMRNIYHYWFHTGQALAVRKILGHTNLPEFVGDMTSAVFHD
jgi:uncharacterized damage-inducible protein DinB